MGLQKDLIQPITRDNWNGHTLFVETTSPLPEGLTVVRMRLHSANISIQPGEFPKLERLSRMPAWSEAIARKYWEMEENVITIRGNDRKVTVREQNPWIRCAPYVVGVVPATYSEDYAYKELRFGLLETFLQENTDIALTLPPKSNVVFDLQTNTGNIRIQGISIADARVIYSRKGKVKVT